MKASQRHLGVTLPRLRIGDLVREAALSVSRHPGRSLVTVIGTILGAAAYVSTVGLGATMNGQVSAVFDARRATEVILQPEDPHLDGGWTEHAAERLGRLDGVVRAGRRITTGEREVRRGVHATQPATTVPLIGADAGALRVMAPAMTAGRLFDRFHDDRRAPVVLLAEPVAQQLGVQRTGVAVFIDDRAYTVIGIYRDVARRDEALAAAIIPYALAGAHAAGGTAPAYDVLIETAPGAAQLIGRQAPLAVRPESAADLRAIAPPDPRTVRREIEGDLTRSTLALSLVALIIGTVSIGNAATAAIAVRAPEIGLRRALGGRPRHVFIQLLLETGLLGGLGGVAGALVGILTVSVVSLVNAWTPVIDLRAAAVASAASAAAGLLAGLVPAARAVRVPPVSALQRSGL